MKFLVNIALCVVLCVAAVPAHGRDSLLLEVADGKSILAAVEVAVEAQDWTQEKPMMLSWWSDPSDLFDAGKEKEKFFGITNVLFGVGMFGSGGLDVKTTYMLLDLPESVTISEPLSGGYIKRTTYFRGGEGLRFMRQYMTKGKAAAWSAKMGIDAGFWVLSYSWRRSDKKAFRLAGWMVPVLITVGQSRLAYLNFERYKEYRDICRRSGQAFPANASDVSFSFTIPIRW